MEGIEAKSWPGAERNSDRMGPNPIIIRELERFEPLGSLDNLEVRPPADSEQGANLSLRPIVFQSRNQGACLGGPSILTLCFSGPEDTRRIKKKITNSSGSGCGRIKGKRSSTRKTSSKKKSLTFVFRAGSVEMRWAEPFQKGGSR